MKPVSLSTLENAVVKPGFEKHLKPLVMYRGAVTLGQAHRMWNLLASGLLHEANRRDIKETLQLNSRFSHLCEPDKKKSDMALYGFLSRLEDNPDVMAELGGMSDYVRWLGGHRFPLIRVSEITYRSRNMGAGGWRRLSRRDAHLPGSNIRQSAPINYPFLIHDGGKPEHDLLRRVNAAVPKYLDPNLRADICQDIIVGILCGDFDEDNLTLPAKEMTKRVQKMFPTKYGPISLDEIMPGTDDYRLIDRISNEDSLWERI